MTRFHAGSVALMLAVLFFSESAASGQSNDKAATRPGAKSGSSPYSIVRSIENIGSEVLSIFGLDSKDESDAGRTGPGGGGPRARKKTKVLVWLEAGQQTYSADQRSCTPGNGVCSFSISLNDPGNMNGQKFNAQASYFPRQKRVQLEFESAPDAQFAAEGGKVKLVVRRAASDQTDANGTILINNKRLLIRNGEYEVVNNTVSLFVD